MYTRRRIQLSVSTALLILFSAVWARTYRVSDRLSRESTGQKTFGLISTGVVTGRGQLLLFRDAIGPPDRQAAPRSRFRHTANPPLHFDLQSHPGLTAQVNIAGFGIFQSKPETAPTAPRGLIFIPSEATYVLLPFWALAAPLLPIAWLVNRFISAARKRRLRRGFDLDRSSAGPNPADVPPAT
jgi:hypothetical protein